MPLKEPEGSALAHFTTKGVGSGSGLGLMISNRIIADHHGGEIEFESKPGETRFKVRLPVTRH